MKKLLPLAAFVAVAAFALQAQASSHRGNTLPQPGAVQAAKVLTVDGKPVQKVEKKAEKK